MNMNNDVISNVKNLFTDAGSQKMVKILGDMALEFFPELSVQDQLKRELERISDQYMPVEKYNAGGMELDIDAIRRDFPILSEIINGKNLIWLDNAATTQKPKCVIDRLKYFYEHENSNVHRSAHTLAQRSDSAYEEARGIVADYIGAPSKAEIIFVRGTTEAINLVAQTYGKQNVGKDDEIIISWLEHHANIVPWQILCNETGARLRVIPVDGDGQLIMSEYERLLSDRTKIVAVTHVSNTLGTITPIHEIIDMAHRRGAIAVIDGAQAVSHMKVDVKAQNCDFYAFSGHKLFGPTGIGVLYAKKDILSDIRPYQSGGNMIKDVIFEKTSFQELPHRYEAGTGNIADAIGLGAAIRYISDISIDKINKYEHSLIEYSSEQLKKMPGLIMLGNSRNNSSILSFVIKDYSSEEIGEALNEKGIAVRTGHHCAQPIIRRYGYESSVRVSLSFYNTFDEIDYLCRSLNEIISRKTYDIWPADDFLNYCKKGFLT